MVIPSSWHWRGQKRHLVTEIKDGDEQLVVYKFWRPTRQFWEYKIEPKSIIEFELKLIERDKE